MRNRAVIFDLDGTLVDTLEDLASSMNAALRAMSFPEHDLEHYRLAVGYGVEQLVMRCLPPCERKPETVKEAIAAMRNEYAVRWNVKSRPYAGIPGLLDALAERSVVTAVLSNKPEEFTRLMVEAQMGKWSFASVHGARDGEKLKPHPHGALCIAEECAIPPAQWLFLGDTDIDMQTAVAAGMYAVGVAWGFRDEESLWAGGADKVITSPMELLDLGLWQD